VRGGTEKWNPTVGTVTVKNGTFAALRDTCTGAAHKFKGSLFLEIKMGTAAPLSPRQPLASVAYAMKAESAELKARMKRLEALEAVVAELKAERK
jgi:hypothetical protein